MKQCNFLGRVKKLFTHITRNPVDMPMGIVISVFVFSFLLELAHFFPNLTQINVWDEASYIYYGYRLLVHGRWLKLADSPLSSILYAITIIPVINSPDFFVIANAIARILYFVLIFISVSLIARELKPYANPWVMIALLTIVPVATTMFLFPSDVLFASISGLAFWQMLAFYNHRSKKHLWWASGLMGVASLARVEGLILIGVMLIVTLIIILPTPKWYRFVGAILLPFVILVGGYVLFFGLVMGEFDTGMAGRSFYNFESGHDVIYSYTGIFSPTVSARLEAREVFGTPEENNNSVFRAISRNPQVYAQRLQNFVPRFNRYAIKAYGNKFTLIFIWLSIRGMVQLVKEKHYPLLLMGVLWFAPLSVAIRNTFIREGYFMMPFFILFSFTSVGLTAMIQNFDDHREKIGMVIGSLFVIVISLLANNTSMLYRGILFILGLVILFLMRFSIDDVKKWQTHAFFLLLAVVLIMRGGYRSPELPRYGRTEMEASVYFLQDNFQVGTNVLSGAPANIWAARMTYFGINSYNIPNFRDQDHFLVWVQSQNIEALYIDRHFPHFHQQFVASLVNDGFVEVFSTSNRDIVIYTVLNNEQD